MTISANVRNELFETTSTEGKLIRIKPTEAKAGTIVYSSKQNQPLKMWTEEEHEKFLEAMERYPTGPWKVIAAYIETKTTRQTMTHAQKYRQKISRWRRGLRHKGRRQHELNDGTSSICSDDHTTGEMTSRTSQAEYISADDVASQCSDDSMTPMDERYPVTHARSELFRLAELASTTGMNYPENHPLNGRSTLRPPRLMGGEIHRQTSHQEIVSSPGKAEEMDWVASHPSIPSREWCTTKTEIKLSPLRSASNGNMGLGNMSQYGDQYYASRISPPPTNARIQLPALYHSNVLHKRSNEFTMPPLNISGKRGTFSIPPLRSKIDPSVLNHPQFTH